VFAAAGSQGVPGPAWWMLAVVGAVLAVVDAETYRLPARLVGPLAATAAVTLTVLAATGGSRTGYSARCSRRRRRRVLPGRADLPSVAWLGRRVPGGIGGGLLGWASWRHVIAGQVLIWLLGPVVLAAVAVVRPARRGMPMAVPMGPALIAGALAATWL